MSLYTSTQKFLRAGFRLFYHKVHIKGKHHIPAQGPVLLVSNHPNSFMDALIIGSYLQRPLNFLARGDAFNNPVLRKIFEAYHMLPVYRISEGKENIEKNFDTFDACYKAVENNQMILVFGEGLCKNNYELRPLKKGPARIAQRAWNSPGSSKNLVIVPVGLTYQHFSGPGKSVVVNYGEPITAAGFKEKVNAPDFVQQLNATLATAIKELAYINDSLQSDTRQHENFMQEWNRAESRHQAVPDTLYKADLYVDAGYKKNIVKSRIHATILSLPHYWLSKVLTKKLTKGSVFYDSILFGMYWFLLPLYLLALAGLILYFI